MNRQDAKNAKEENTPRVKLDLGVLRVNTELATDGAPIWHR